mgnify:CR=1 FL=1
MSKKVFMKPITNPKRVKKGEKKWKKHRKYEPLGIGVMGYSDEFLCPHGIGHEKGVHGCDSCCIRLTDVIKYFKSHPKETVYYQSINDKPKKKRKQKNSN